MKEEKKDLLTTGKLNNNYRHGHASVGGMTPTYRSWYGAKTRCTSPNQSQWKDYGGRGITMCDRWMNSFEAFLKDMGERPENTTLDRIEGHLGYQPGNCKWSTFIEQNRHSRRVVATPEIREKIKELSSTLSQPKIAKQVGVSVSTVNRIVRGVSWSEV
jgi:transcriptional regulator with XRE-family HTH domain